jgi:hypothetical protein
VRFHKYFVIFFLCVKTFFRTTLSFLVLSFYFVYVHECHQPYYLTFMSSIHSPTSHRYPSHYLFCSPLSLLIPKSIFKGLSLCISHCENILLWSVQPLPLFSFTSSLPHPTIQQLSMYHYILYLHRCNIFLYC